MIMLSLRRLFLDTVTSFTMANVDKSKNCLGLLNHFERVKGLERNLKNSSPTKLLEFCQKKKEEKLRDCFRLTPFFSFAANSYDKSEQSTAVNGYVALAPIEATLVSPQRRVNIIAGHL